MSGLSPLATTAESSPNSTTVLPPSPVRIEDTLRFKIARPARASDVGVCEKSSAFVSESSACNSASSNASCEVANDGMSVACGMIVYEK